MLRAVDITCKTDTGRQRRENEDSAYAQAPLFVVADGMGGAQAGEVASQIAIEAFEEALPDAGGPEERLAERVREANRRIYELSRAERERAGMGTTLTAAYLDDASLAIAHVGDSRAYLFRDGQLKRLTRDHSLVDELVRRGKLTEEQAAEHPQRSIITRALGPEPDVEVDTWTYPVRAGDVLLLCSDGLTSMLSEQEVERILVTAPSLDEAGTELIAGANAAGGRDNITVVLFGVEDPGGPGVEDPGEPGVEDPGGPGPDDGHTLVGVPVIDPQTSDYATPEAVPDSSPVAPAPGSLTPGVGRVRRARRLPPEPVRDDPRSRPHRRWVTPVAALLAVLFVVFVIGGAGYLASRQLFFIGTNGQGVVTVFRGFPYDLPAGIHLYETYYVSGVPASSIPADRRGAVLDNHLRSQTDATNVIRDLELGKISQ